MARSTPGIALIACALRLPSTAIAQGDPAAARGVGFLRRAVGGGNPAENALGALALVKAEVPASDPAVARTLEAVRKQFANSTFTPATTTEIYESAVLILFLASLDASSHRGDIAAVARFLGSRQNPNGSWDYASRDKGDSSISQYALLGLWEAENSGVSVSPSIWDSAARWYISTQSETGGWTYHPGETTDLTVSMTAAGVGSLLICERQLAPYRSPPEIVHPLMTPLYAESDRKKFTPEVSPQRLSLAIRGGMNWLAANFAASDPRVMGHSPYYALYGVERIGALADQATLGRRDWFAEGSRFLAASQRPDGAFASQYGELPNTSWAVLFLSKATAKSIARITVRRLGAGTLIGGRGLPRDLSQISVAGGHVVARPMDGAVEGMLAVLEDPRIEDAASALAGLVGRYRTEGPAALRPHEDRFRRLLTDPDPGVRRVAAWALGRTGDLSMAAPLVDALRDPEDAVVTEARLSLQLLSRKVEGLGPPPSPTLAQREAAIGRWRAWFDAARPLAGPVNEPRPRRPGGPLSAAVAPPAPRLRGESAHDRVTSLLLAVILGAALVTGWLSVIAATTSAYQARSTRPVMVIEVSGGGGGGTPDGQPGSTEAVEVAGAEAADMASNNEEDAGDFEPPSVEARPAAMLDTVAEAGQNLAEVNLSAVMPRGGKVATGRKRSKLGTGGLGYGFGPGDGGVRREDRWSIVYKNGQPADEYARQIDALGVELAIVSGNQLIYASNFASAKPTTRRGSGSDDKRLYFVWRGQGRKESDLALLEKAGLDVGEGVIFQFYPARVESTLEKLEVRYKGRQPAEIRGTRFGVVPAGNSYGFEVLSQETLR